jgi:alanine racemase
MGRGGVAAADLADVVAAIDATPGVTLGSVWSHLADGSDPEVSHEQIRRYEAALSSLVAGGRAMPTRHVTATEGLFRATAPAYDMVRVGLGFYGELGVGVEPAPETAGLAGELRGAMTLKVRPIRIEEVPAGSTIGYGGEWTTERPSRIATLPIGYADGWTRAYWPGATGLVRGRRVPLVGRVSMDSVCADVTDVPGIGYDDEIVLLGEQDGERITASDLARLRGSIPNEVFCAFGPRLPRIAVLAGTT